MADTQEAPQSTVQPLPELPGGLREAQNALLNVIVGRLFWV